MPMPVAFDQINVFPSPTHGSVRRGAGNRRLVTAICGSLLLHGLLLTAYSPWNVTGDEAQPTSAWSHYLDVTIRAPLSPSVDSVRDTIRIDRTIAGARAARKNPATQLDRGDVAASTSSSVAVPISPSDAGDSGAAIEPSPAIDLDAARDIARQMARARSPGQGQTQNPAQQRFPQYPSSTERETPLRRAIARSLRSDCRIAYAGAGLFAIPLLVRDAVTGSGCRW